MLDGNNVKQVFEDLPSIKDQVERLCHYISIKSLQIFRKQKQITHVIICIRCRKSKKKKIEKSKAFVRITIFSISGKVSTYIEIQK